jgi:hypothetical protein
MQEGGPIFRTPPPGLQIILKPLLHLLSYYLIVILFFHLDYDHESAQP